MRPSVRRLATAVAFAGLLTVILVLLPLLRGDEVDGFVVLFVPLIGVALGYLSWPAFVAAARAGAAMPARERLPKVAASMAAGVGVAIVAGGVVAQRGVEAGNLLSGVVIFVVLFAFVALMPRIAGVRRS